jgi:hypothetical protein
MYNPQTAYTTALVEKLKFPDNFFDDSVDSPLFSHILWNEFGRNSHLFNAFIPLLDAVPYKFHRLVRCKIVDIGCGINFFKNILPNVIGIDSCQEADVNDFFDRTFSIGNTNQHKYAISIDALHFIPITDFYNRVLEFENIIQPGGRGYLAMNCARLVDNTNHNTLLKLFSTKQPTNKQLANYIDQEIRKLPLKFLVIDNLILDCYDEFIDGNIRLVFEKQGETA